MKIEEVRGRVDEVRHVRQVEGDLARAYILAAALFAAVTEHFAETGDELAQTALGALDALDALKLREDRTPEQLGDDMSRRVTWRLCLRQCERVVERLSVPPPRERLVALVNSLREQHPAPSLDDGEPLTVRLTPAEIGLVQWALGIATVHGATGPLADG